MLGLKMGAQGVPSVLAFCLLTWALLPVATAISQDDTAVYPLLQTAANAQKAGDFQIALSQYEQVFQDHADSPEVGKAYYNAGVCAVELGQFEKASAYLAKAGETLGEARAVLLPQSRLLLGFAQLRWGKQLAGESGEKSQQQLVAAVKSLDDLIGEHPEFADIDQAYFFKADAQDTLQQLDQAKATYQQMLALPKVQFKQDGLFSLGNLHERTGQLDQALALYRQFLSEDPQHPSATEVQFRLAETLNQSAMKAEANGQTELAQQAYQQAEPVYQVVIDAQVDRLSTEALFQQAMVVSRQRDYARSAELFSQVAKLPGIGQPVRALTYAGRDYLRSGQGALAETSLEQAIGLEGPYAAEAAHWLAKTHLQNNQYEKAFAVAHPWIAKTGDPQLQVPLILDAADAAYGSSARRKASVDLYLRVVNEFGQHPLVPTALYNAAYAAMEVGDLARAIELTEQFESKFPQDSFLPDTLEVRGDTLLLTQDPARAEVTFRQLATAYPDHAKRNLWVVRAGLAGYLQGKDQQVIDWLEGSIEQLQAGPVQAEAWHWIGSSYFRLGQPQAAIQALGSSRTANTDWRRADETLLTLSRACQADEQVELAKSTAKQLLETYPASPLRAEAQYRLAEYAYAQGAFAEAQSEYRAVTAQHAESKFVPFALYGQGWSQVQQEDLAGAIGTFSELIDQYPQHSLTQQALMGRATSLRRNGRAAESVADVKRALETEGNLPKVDLLYELGLAQIEQQDWKQVAQTFRELVERVPDGERTDQFYYELAWALKSDNQSDAAAAEFLNLATRFPDSQQAAEANFHVAQSAYEQQDFARAIQHYVNSLKTGQDPALQEKATYKLAWSHYKQGNFQTSQDWFAKQVEQFKEGPLYADGLFMVSESLYKLRDHDSAFQAYRVAKPVVDASASVSPEVRHLTMLHGGQSANQAKKYSEAIEFMKPIIEGQAEERLKQDAYLQIGIAHAGLKQPSEAVECWEQAARNLGETGAHARCMLGDQLFTDKKFEEAITQFKLTFYGYGGTSAAPEVQAWQAYAAYEAARCRVVQIGTAGTAEAQQKFKTEAIKHFEFLIENYPDDRLAAQASKELEKLLGSQ
ncbi:MAG: tetratricopeptide repeat protein [Mariniblastus sp.]|nr:tetratricopeptide repeat protein [Mariniblastus sp.]